jgi:hypothetical protein
MRFPPSYPTSLAAPFAARPDGTDVGAPPRPATRALTSESTMPYGRRARASRTDVALPHVHESARCGQFYCGSPHCPFLLSRKVHQSGYFRVRFLWRRSHDQAYPDSAGANASPRNRPRLACVSATSRLPCVGISGGVTMQPEGDQSGAPAGCVSEADLPEQPPLRCHSVYQAGVRLGTLVLERAPVSV